MTLSYTSVVSIIYMISKVLQFYFFAANMTLFCYLCNQPIHKQFRFNTSTKLNKIPAILQVRRFHPFQVDQCQGPAIWA